MPRIRPTKVIFLCARGSARRVRVQTPHFSSSRTITSKPARTFPPPSFPVVESCPDPTCPCSSTPALDQEIDYKNTLNGTISAHNQHLIVSTGQSDWTSKIEDESDNGTAWGRIMGDLKSLLGRKGEFQDAFGATMISTSSFTPSLRREDQNCITGQSSAAGDSQETVDALLFPAFRHYSGLVPLSNEPTNASSIIQPETDSVSFSVSKSSHDLKDFVRESLSSSTGTSAVHVQQAEKSPWKSTAISNPTILICSHGQRDSRCGILGPVLQSEFVRYLDQRNRGKSSINFSAAGTSQFVASNGTASSSTSPKSSEGNSVPVNLGMISHIGGHKWAGNVILYIPPTFTTSSTNYETTTPHPLAGRSVWYGRVEPRHVEGIVEQTLVEGKVIKELFRGGLDQQGQILRL